MARYTYSVRHRDVLTGRETWLMGPGNTPMVFDDRLSADLAALLSNQKAPEWQYAHVIELDLDCEEIMH